MSLYKLIVFISLSKKKIKYLYVLKEIWEVIDILQMGFKHKGRTGRIFLKLILLNILLYFVRKHYPRPRVESASFDHLCEHSY